jgi:hypothetical protein
VTAAEPVTLESLTIEMGSEVTVGASPPSLSGAGAELPHGNGNGNRELPHMGEEELPIAPGPAAPVPEMSGIALASEGGHILREELIRRVVLHLEPSGAASSSSSSSSRSIGSSRSSIGGSIGSGSGSGSGAAGAVSSSSSGGGGDGVAASRRGVSDPTRLSEAIEEVVQTLRVAPLVDVNASPLEPRAWAAKALGLLSAMAVEVWPRWHALLDH